MDRLQRTLERTMGTSDILYLRGTNEDLLAAKNSGKSLGTYLLSRSLQENLDGDNLLPVQPGQSEEDFIDFLKKQSGLLEDEDLSSAMEQIKEKMEKQNTETKKQKKENKKRQTMTGMRMNPKKSQRRRRFLRPKIILRANLHPSQNLLHKKSKTTTKTTLNQKKKKSPRPMRNRNSLMIRMTINEAVHKGVFCPCLWSFRPDQGW